LSRDANPRRRRSLVADLGIIGAYVGLAIAMTWPLAREFRFAIPGDGFDGWQNYWNLWWVKTALVVLRTDPFFTTLLFYPTGVSLLFHTLNVFNGVLSLPIQLAFGLFPAYNAVVLFSFAVGGFGAYLLVLQTLGTPHSRLPAFAAGVIFSFSPFHFAHLLGHMQVISLEWIPFFAVYLLRIVQGAKREDVKRRGAKRRDVLLAALFLVLVGLCDLYYVLYCLLFTAVVLAWAIWRAWRSRTHGAVSRTGQTSTAFTDYLRRRVDPLPQAILGVAAVWILFGLVLSPQLVPMVAAARQSSYMVPDPAQSRLLSADLTAFVTPQEYHPLWGGWATERGRLLVASPAEHQVFAGFTVLILATLGLWAGWHGLGRRKADLGPWPLALLVFFLLSLGPVLHIGGRSALLPGGSELPLLYDWLARVVPFMEITRSVSRFDVMVMLSLGVLASVAMLWLWNIGKAGRIAAVLALGLILFEFLPAPYPMSPPDTPAWYAALAQDPRPGAVLNLPMKWDRPGYLLHQTVHGKPLTVAYISRDDPRTLTERAPVLQHFRHLGPDIIQFSLAEQGKQVLNDLGVRWVVLDRYQMPAGEERAYTDATAAEIFGNQTPLYRDDRITVFEVPAAETLEPYLILGEGWETFNTERGTRSFWGSATVTVRSPAEGDVTLLVKPAPGSEALNLPGSGDRYTKDLHVQRGDNVIRLSAVSPDRQAIIASLSLNLGEGDAK
jgi:hypothetical protein